MTAFWTYIFTTNIFFPKHLSMCYLWIIHLFYGNQFIHYEYITTVNLNMFSLWLQYFCTEIKILKKTNSQNTTSYPKNHSTNTFLFVLVRPNFISNPYCNGIAEFQFFFFQMENEKRKREEGEEKIFIDMSSAVV